ncbi:MAG: FesM, partial [Vicinamibacterales bacterium]
SVADDMIRYAVAFVPFGFGMWLAHYAFHFLTGALTIVPVAQSAIVDAIGWAALGDPQWRWAGLRPGALFPIQIGFVLLGTIGSLAVAHGISEREHPTRAGVAVVPWAVVLVALAATAVWVLSQPMEMRGMEFPG